MKLLLTVREQDIDAEAPVVDTKDFKKRAAARAVVFDAASKVALLHVGRDNYHKLPGGGIDAGEDTMRALERELLEEIGCQAEVTGELGEVMEFRDKQKLAQTSYCFTAHQVGEKGAPDFTKEELEKQFSIVWADSLDGAIVLLEQDEARNYAGKFIQIRDLAILRAAISN